MKLSKDNFVHPAEKEEVKDIWLKKYRTMVCRRMLILNMEGTEKWFMLTRVCMEK